MARDDLGNCYDPISSYIDPSYLRGPDRELFVVIDQTIVPDKKLKLELLKKTLGYIKEGDKINVLSFSAYANKHYTELHFTGTMGHSLKESTLHDTPSKLIKKFNRCQNNQKRNGNILTIHAIKEAMTLSDETYDFNNTELIGALNTLATDLFQKSDTTQKTILLFSDMVENSLTSSFLKKGKVRLFNPDIELAKFKKAELIPDLSGLKVYVIGAGWFADGSLYQDSRKIKALRTFWEKFFKASNAKLEGFGTPMLLTEIK